MSSNDTSPTVTCEIHDAVAVVRMDDGRANAISEQTLCYDLSYAMDTTPFAAWARNQGAGRSVMGWGMLVEQAAESFRIWRDVRPDTAAVLRQLPINA